MFSFKRIFFVILLLAIGLLVSNNILRFTSPLKVPPIIGVHYYSWFPDNWNAGHVGEHLSPPVLPVLGKYSSSNPEVFKQHIQWAKDAGINLFIFDWWSKRKSLKKNIESNVNNPELIQDMKFAIMYESHDLKNPKDKKYEGEGDNIIVMNEERAVRMKKDWVHLAKKFMHHSNYLHINGRAVLFVYATRHIVGDEVSAAISEAREFVYQQTGEELYLIGDEVYFNVLDRLKDGKIIMLEEGVPNWDRLKSFDALTAYNLYDSSQTEHGGSKGYSKFLADGEALYIHYQEICSKAGIVFIPGILSAYNDRGVRLQDKHFVIPRLFNGKTFFEQSLERWGFPFLDKEVPMLTITSWNEWNEGTQIEPSLESEQTSKDDSEDGNEYSMNEIHLGYGKLYIDILANKLKEHKENQANEQ